MTQGNVQIFWIMETKVRSLHHSLRRVRRMRVMMWKTFAGICRRTVLNCGFVSGWGIMRGRRDREREDKRC